MNELWKMVYATCDNGSWCFHHHQQLIAVGLHLVLCGSGCHLYHLTQAEQRINMPPTYCPSCGEPSVPPCGNPKSKVLIIGEMPGREELEQGRIFVGPAGIVFKKELNRLGLDLKDFRLCNVWLHEPTKDENCLKAGKDIVLEEAKKKKAILLVGSEAVSTFTEYSVSKVCGLEVPSVFTCKHVWAIVNPAICFHSSHGELRLGLEKWVSFLKREKLI